ncbi:MAG TPA: hypothetical protein VM165_07615, partial [Planctomycetaceae bacterium]|nr:hypothetical protein [Planctomycetaceae bacterium]
LGFQIYQNQQHSDPNPPSSLGIQFQAGERNLMAQTHPASWSELLLRRTELAGVWTGDKLAFFVNGRTAPLSGPYQPNVQMDSLKGFVIGSHVHGNGTLVAGWGGVIERLRVSKSARYAADYEPPLEYAVDADALAVYRFDEGRGATLNDASGNGHHGTIVKATWVDTTKPATDR